MATQPGEDESTLAPSVDDRFEVPLRGIKVDAETRCAHYDTPEDVIAIRFGCCDTYYPCYQCHAAASDHAPERIPREAFDEPSILCGRCRTTLSVHAYLESEDECPACGAAFNPNCRDHHDRYFED